MIQIIFVLILIGIGFGEVQATDLKAGWTQLLQDTYDGKAQEVEKTLKTNPALFANVVNPAQDKTFGGFNALHLAAYQGHSSFGNVDVVPVILSAITSPNLLTQKVENNDTWTGCNALHIAVIKGHRDVVRLLVKNEHFKAAITEPVTGAVSPWHGFNILQIVAATDNLRIAEDFALPAGKFSPLNLSQDIEKTLCEAKVNQKGNEFDGMTAWEIAKKNNKQNIISALKKLSERAKVSTTESSVSSLSQDSLKQALDLLKAKLLFLASLLISPSTLNPSSSTIKPLYITLVEGDITKQKFVLRDQAAIVNAANKHLTGGGGVDGAIHAAADKNMGEGSLAQHNEIVFAGDDTNRCPVGDARLGPSFGIYRDEGAKFIIYANGPLGSSATREKDLTNAIQNCLTVANKGINEDVWITPEGKKWDVPSWNNFYTTKQTITAIAFTAISAGSFGYFSNLSAPVVIKTVIDYLKINKNAPFKEIRFVTLQFNPEDNNDYEAYKKAIEQHPNIFQKIDEKNIDAGLKKSLEESCKDTKNNDTTQTRSNGIEGKPFVVYKYVPSP